MPDGHYEGAHTWAEYRMFVMNELKENRKANDDNAATNKAILETVEDVKLDLQKIITERKVKNGIFGAIFGFVAGAIPSIVDLMYRHQNH